MLKYLSTDWTSFAYDLEYPGTAEDKFFYYLRTLGYTGSVDDMLYAALVNKGYTLSNVLSLAPEDVFAREPTDLFSGEAGVWYDPSDLSTLFQDAAGTIPVTSDGDPVGLMLDKSGNGNDATQIGDDTTRPVYRTANGAHWIESVGVGYLRTLFTFTQGWMRISALRQNSWLSGTRLYGEIDALEAGILQATGSSPTIRLVDGLAACHNTGAVIGRDVVVVEKHDGDNSYLEIGDSGPSTGNPGSSRPKGLTLFANDFGTQIADIRCYGLVMIDRLLTTSELVQLSGYYATKKEVS